MNYYLVCFLAAGIIGAMIILIATMSPAVKPVKYLDREVD